MFLEESSNSACVDYLFSVLPKCCDENDVDRICQFVDNERLADGAIRALADIPNSGDYFVKYMANNQTK